MIAIDGYLGGLDGVDLRFQYIHAPLVKRVYAECSPLFQLIKLINSLRNDPNDTIIKKLLLQELSWINMIPSAEQKIVMQSLIKQ